MLTMQVSRKAPEYGQDREFDTQVETTFAEIWPEIFADRAMAYRRYLEADILDLLYGSNRIDAEMRKWIARQKQELRQEMWSHEYGFVPQYSSDDLSLSTENEQLRHEVTLQREMRKAIQDKMECPACGYRFDGDDS